MRYSKALVKGKWWRTFGYLLLIGCDCDALEFCIPAELQLFPE